MSLPPICQLCTSPKALDDCLCTLLEPSHALKDHLVPALSSTLVLCGGEPNTYSEVIDLVEREVSTWSLADKADFLGGHPRIGETNGLSAFSKKEQAGTKARPTPPHVLRKLETLNALFESKYPGLRYVTFVNGRTRAQVADDLEFHLLGVSGDEMRDDEGICTDPTLTYEFGSPEWVAELERGLEDVFKIAKARLKGVGLQ